MLEEMAQAIYREWFVHFRYPGHEDAPFVDSPLGPIPDGWTTGAYSGNVAQNNRATLNPREGTERGVGPLPAFAAFDDGRVPVIETGAAMKSGKLLFNEESVLLAKLNPRIRLGLAC